MPGRLTVALERRPDGRLVVVCGASRSGKTIWTRRQTERAPRLLVWDSVGEWSDVGNCERITDLRELARRCAPPARSERLAFVGPITPAMFDAFCRLAWVWVRVAPGVLVIEELADVTSPGKAPPAWGEIVRKGLRYGPHIYALTQRPAESDKTVIGNASVIHCHRMARSMDRGYMARELDISQDQLDALKPLDFIERDATGRISSGRVKI